MASSSLEPDRLAIPRSYVTHPLTTELLGDCTVLLPGDWQDDAGLVLLVTPILEEPPLVRIQSRCTYGEVFGSAHCDCRAQLHAACQQLKNEGGLLFYLEQEGRGAGSMAKARAYSAHADRLIDSFSFYEEVGLAADLRDYTLVASVLTALSLPRIRLLTNNPSKLSALREAGIAVEHVPLRVSYPPLAEPYIQAKRARGHLL